MEFVKIYVIIVTYNGMKWIDRCIGDLRKSTIPVRTIVVDNGSIDGTVDFITQNYPEVEIYVMEKNLGFGQANNYGIKIALKRDCDYVYLLNQDAYVFPDMFEQLLKAHKDANEGKIGILSPMHLYRDCSHFDNHFKGYISSGCPEIVQDMILNEPKSYYYVEGVPAAGWLMPSSTLETIGGFDPIFFHYDEDNNYIQRLNYHGLRTVIVPSAKMIHDREEFGNISLATRDQIFRTLKCYYFLNINYTKATLFRKLCHIGSVNFIHSVKALFGLKFRLSWEYHSAMLRCLFNIGKFRADRKMNKRIGATWLQ